MHKACRILPFDRMVQKLKNTESVGRNKLIYDADRVELDDFFLAKSYLRGLKLNWMLIIKKGESLLRSQQVK